MTMHGRKSQTAGGRIAMPLIRVFGWAVACALALAPISVLAAGEAAPGDVARLQGEIDRLKQELADQRQLILQLMQAEQQLSLIHISEPTRLLSISYAVFCLK